VNLPAIELQSGDRMRIIAYARGILALCGDDSASDSLYLIPREAMGYLAMRLLGEDQTEPELRRLFQELRNATQPREREIRGNIRAIHIDDWRATIQSIDQIVQTTGTTWKNAAKHFSRANAPKTAISACQKEITSPPISLD
jgi:hypothetical protein